MKRDLWFYAALAVMITAVPAALVLNIVSNIWEPARELAVILLIPAAVFGCGRAVIALRELRAYDREIERLDQRLRNGRSGNGGL